MMELTIVQLILIGILGFVAMVDGVGPKVLLLALPLVASAAVGLILGNLTVAIMTGATLQIMLIAAIPIGGASPPDGTSASIVGSALAVVMYTPPQDLLTYYANTIALAIIPFAIVVAVIGVQLDILARTANIAWIRRAERAIDKGNIGAIQTSHVLGFVPWGLSRAILCPLALVVGLAAVNLLKSIAYSTTGVLAGLIVAGSMLPAAGLAVILSILPFRRMPWFFIIGFAVSTAMVLLSPYLSFVGAALNPILVATGLGFIIAFLMVRRRYKAESVEGGKSKAEKQVQFKRIEKNDLSSAFRRYFFTFESSWNYERMQGLGYLFTMLPILKRVHKDKNELRDAMKLHMEFFNTNPFVAPWIIGMNAKVEDEGAPPEAIRSLKVGYMGPMAGLGDSLIYFVIGGIAMLIGSSISYLTGNILGVIVLWVILSPLAIALRFWFFRVGLRSGAARAKEMSTGKGLKRIMELTGATGLTTIGAFIPIAVQVGLPVLVFPIELQPIVNTISLFVIPLAITLVSYLLARRGFSIVKIVLILFVLGFVLGFVGVLSRIIYWSLALPS
jgi:PTS system mannose-specific IID component